MLFLALVLTGVSCGGGSSQPTNPGTPTGAVPSVSVSVTIDGTSATVPNLTLTVQ